MSFLEVYIGCLIAWINNYIIGKRLFEYKQKNNILKIIITLLIFTLILTVINVFYLQVLHGVLKIIISYILICIFFKILFKREMSYTIVSSLILHLIIFISEVTLALLISMLIKLINQPSLLFLMQTVVMNILTASLGYAIFRISENKIIKIVKNTKFNSISSFLIIIVLLVAIALLFTRIPVSKWNFNSEFIITMIILLCTCMLGILMLRQKSIIQKTNLMYHQLAQYSDITNNVLEEYRVANHEYKNQLLIIRSMINKKNKELIEYTDNLLEKVENIKYKWVGQLNHLPLSGLKGLINYKILEMETLKLNKVISISNEVSKIKLNKLTLKQKDNLYSIVGVYLDNAIYASKESKQKEISLEVYKEKKELVIILANTYKGKLDLEKINDYGYTTKGKNHGVGLHLVNQIISSDATFQVKKYLLDNYFVQELRVNLKNIDIKSK